MVERLQERHEQHLLHHIRNLTQPQQQPGPSPTQQPPDKLKTRLIDKYLKWKYGLKFTKPQYWLTSSSSNSSSSSYDLNSEKINCCSSSSSKTTENTFHSNPKLKNEHNSEHEEESTAASALQNTLTIHTSTPTKNYNSQINLKEESYIRKFHELYPKYGRKQRHNSFASGFGNGRNNLRFVSKLLLLLFSLLFFFTILLKLQENENIKSNTGGGGGSGSSSSFSVLFFFCFLLIFFLRWVVLLKAV